MSVAAHMCSISVVLAVLLFGAFLWLTRPRRCPRCGGREWVLSPHRGPFVAYCRGCLLEVDLSGGGAS